MEDYDLVEKQKCMEDEGRPRERLKVEAQMVISQQRREAGYPYGKMGRAEDDWTRKLMRPRKEDVIAALVKMMGQPRIW